MLAAWGRDEFSRQDCSDNNLLPWQTLCVLQAGLDNLMLCCRKIGDAFVMVCWVYAAKESREPESNQWPIDSCFVPTVNRSTNWAITRCFLLWCEMFFRYTLYTNNHQYLLESVSVLASLATSACVCSTSFTCYKLMNNVSAHIHFQLLSIKPQLECRPSVHPSRCLQT